MMMRFDTIAGADNAHEIRDWAGDAGVEKAVDCTANDKSRLTCIEAARKGGQIVCDEESKWDFTTSTFPLCFWEQDAPKESLARQRR